MRQDLERGLNPLVLLPPRYLFGSALLCQAVALGVGLPALADIAAGVLATAVAVGVVVLGVMLVDYTVTPLGSVAHRLRALASASTAFMVVGFTLAWYLHIGGGARIGVFGIELVAFAVGMFGAREHGVEDREADVVGESDGWPFRSAA